MHFLEGFLLLCIHASRRNVSQARSFSISLHLMLCIPSCAQVLIASHISKVEACSISGEKEKSRSNQKTVTHYTCVSHMQTTLHAIFDSQKISLCFMHEKRAAKCASNYSMQGSQPEESNEVHHVSLSNTSTHPGAMMVLFLDTYTTLAAVERSWWADLMTSCAHR